MLNTMFNVAVRKSDNRVIHLFRTDWYSPSEADEIQTELISRFKAPEYEVMRIERSQSQTSTIVS